MSSNRSQEIQGASVLVVDDELVIRQVVERALSIAGYLTLLAATGEEGLSLLREKKPELVILDLRLPDLSGHQICKAIRQDAALQNTRVLILTGQDTLDLASQSLDGGADDYLSKPFDIKELISRVRALLRRPAVYGAGAANIVKGSVQIDLAAHHVSIHGKEIQSLAPKEFELFKHLVMNAPRVLNKDTLALAVWNKTSRDLHPRTIDVHIRRIRHKLEPSQARFLKTVPSLGYQWLSPARD